MHHTVSAVPQSDGVDRSVTSTCAPVVRFGTFELDASTGQLTRNGRRVPLQDQPARALVLLASRPGQLVTREELRQVLWPVGTFVDFDTALNIVVTKMRHALGDSAGSPRFIETVPKHGYRFIADVHEAGHVRPVATLASPAALPGAAAPQAGATDRVRSGPTMWRPAVAGLAAGVVIAAVAFRYALRPDATAPGPIRLEAVPLTSYPGRESQPTLSPDGSLVAFTWDGENQDNQDIYVKAIGAEQPLRLTSDPARDGSPAWSPDGTFIAFLRERPAGGSDVLLIPASGAPERRLGEVQGLADQGLSWSHDGRSLAVVDRLSPAERFGIFVMDIGSGARRRLAAPPSTFGDILPSFSPDGRTVAFSRTLEGPGPFVHTVSAAGGEPRRLVPTRFPRGRLAWSPSGTEILFAAVPVAADGAQPGPSAVGTASPSLWRVRVDDMQARALAGTEHALHVAVAGDRLVYSQETTDLDIWRLDLRQATATGDAQTRVTSSTKADANPQFSPNGARITLTSDRSGEQAIWVVDGQGRHPLRLTSFGRDGYAASPRWSPDGKEIVFDCVDRHTKNSAIYVVSAAGGAARRVTTSSAIDHTPSWSRDGAWIYFGSNRSGSWQVWKVSRDGEQAGPARQLTRGGGFNAIESPTGHVYFTRRLAGLEQQTSLWRIPVEGGSEEVVVKGYRGSSGSWDLTAEGLYFVDQRPSGSGTSWVVRFQAFDLRLPTTVARLLHPPFLGGPAISVSRDGRWMLSTQSQSESDLMLVEHFR